MKLRIEVPETANAWQSSLYFYLDPSDEGIRIAIAHPDKDSNLEPSG
jgi:hypothetical protein